MSSQHAIDEGYNDEDVLNHSVGHRSTELPPGLNSAQECEELAFQLLASLPRARLATIQRRLAPLLQFDVVGSLPAEVSLQIFSHLPFPALLTCGLVSRRWSILANDQTLWKRLCDARGWEWRHPSGFSAFTSASAARDTWNDSDDEGMGDSDEEADAEEVADTLMSELEAAKAKLTLMHAELDSGLASMSFSSFSPMVSTSINNISRASIFPPPNHSNSSSTSTLRPRAIARHSAPSLLASIGPGTPPKPNHKNSSSNSSLQTRGASNHNSHTNTIYCLQLYTYPSGIQVLFTGSRDKTVREWNLSTGTVERVISGVHLSSVLSICAHNGLLATAGSDRKVVVWDLEQLRVVKVISDHEESVLCVRFDDARLVSCSKDRTVRTYLFPDLAPQFVLRAHRAAVNAVSISDTLIVSGSGDRSIRLWDAKTGNLLRTFENHHSRGIASIDFKPPYVLSGSSDQHLRLFDITTLQGWSTSPEYESNPEHAGSQASPLPSSFVPAFQSVNVNTSLDGFSTILGPAYQNVAFGQPGQAVMCRTCGNSGLIPLGGNGRPNHVHRNMLHRDLVRSVAFGDDFVLSGSYDLSIKIWDRKTGALVADLSGGHTGRIFCIGFDRTKIVSCGEDQRICIWDFAHGIDTSFIEL